MPVAITQVHHCFGPMGCKHRNNSIAQIQSNVKTDHMLFCDRAVLSAEMCGSLENKIIVIVEKAIIVRLLYICMYS